MKKFLAILATGTLLIFGLLIGQPASAHSDTPAPVWWELHSASTPEHPFVEPQTYVASGYFRDLKCETWYQVDQYKLGHPFGTTITTLTGSNVDGQWLDYSHPFASTGKPWKFVYGGDCTTTTPSPEPSPDPSPEPTPPTDEPKTPDAPTPTPVVATPQFTG